jgi:uncharacterized protein YxjI
MQGIRDRHADVGGVQYQMREKIFSIGDDFWIETPTGERALKVSGKALRVRDTLELQSPSDEDAALILAAAVCIDRMSHD